MKISENYDLGKVIEKTLLVNEQRKIEEQQDKVKEPEKVKEVVGVNHLVREHWSKQRKRRKRIEENKRRKKAEAIAYIENYGKGSKICG